LRQGKSQEDEMKTDLLVILVVVGCLCSIFAFVYAILDAKNFFLKLREKKEERKKEENKERNFSIILFGLIEDDKEILKLCKRDFLLGKSTGFDFRKQLLELKVSSLEAQYEKMSFYPAHLMILKRRLQTLCDLVLSSIAKHMQTLFDQQDKLEKEYENLKGKLNILSVDEFESISQKTWKIKREIKREKSTFQVIKEGMEMFGLIVYDSHKPYLSIKNIDLDIEEK